ncbi:MAG: hypothetical protein FWE69_00575 [Clostridiales bacterium]|nr:hypothetical protein [Clostridiales bacterium]
MEYLIILVVILTLIRLILSDRRRTGTQQSALCWVVKKSNRPRYKGKRLLLIKAA